MPVHTAVWIDHALAKVFTLHPSPDQHRHLDDVDTATVHAPAHHIHRHGLPRGGQAPEHRQDALHFFQEVAATLADADAVFLMGPASAKLELQRYLQDTHPHVAERVTGVETVDHPTDHQIVAMARKAFTASDRMGR